MALLPLDALTAGETRRLLDDIEAVQAQAAALRSRVLGHAGRLQLPAQVGATSVAAWHAVGSRTSRREACARVRLADRLASYGVLAAAFGRGGVTEPKARVIVRALDALPPTLGLEVLGKAERHLVELAAHHDPDELRRLGRAILEVAAPDVADEHEDALLEKEERAAERKAFFSMYDDGRGSCVGRFRVPVLQGAMLRKMLGAIANPQREHTRKTCEVKPASGEREPAQSGPVVTAERRGKAFMELIERIRADRLPQSGGRDAAVVVMMSLATLLGERKAAQLDTGERISAGQARRLACAAGVIPAVLGEEVAGPRPRPEGSVPQQGAAASARGPAGRQLRGRGLRPACRVVRRPP